ncbi:hypothetical protein RH915_02770 [Serpentinicella sp. ANB-PHB4]|uniref:hypothetical protein n=1 Tax=Serpentinicella sp. ANB-PHB4 TaxID=3074076 RepID=UPI00286567AD|nr:hypothetical protein [Serpentinicella sp. ANB-PHB4]MDR5658404.1 hypothetical protein [Serpentinicella sp. ANB-PHB4]
MTIEHMYFVNFIIAAVVCVFLILEGFHKYRQKEIIFHNKVLSILLLVYLFMTLITSFIRVEQEYKKFAVVFLLAPGVIFVYRLYVEVISRRITIYDIEKKEAIYLVKSVLEELKIEYNHEVNEKGKNIFKIKGSKAKITLKEVPVFENNKEVLVLNSYDFTQNKQFQLGLKDKTLEVKKEKSKLRGIGEIITGGTLIIIIAIILVIYK